MMKRKLVMSVAVLGSLFLAVIAFSCNKDDDESSKKYTISGNASGAQEVPAFTTSGTGTITGVYDADKNTLDYTITWTGLSGTVTNMHFHGPADPTISGDVQIGITGWSATTAGSISGMATLNETQEADLLAGKWYYNIHTTAKGSGEIRGNMSAVLQY